MSLNLLASLLIFNFPRAALPSRGPIHFKSLVTSRSDIIPAPVQCKVSNKISGRTTIVQRSANYQPPIWDYDYIQSLRSEYPGEEYKKLKKQVRMMLHKVVEPLEQLKLINTLQRLGLSYHIESEMRRILEGLYNNDHCGDTWKEENLYVSKEVFNSFMEGGNFKRYLCNDTKGMLTLYEASFLSIEEFVNHNNDQYLSTMVSHALELPLHWRILRVEARWFIDVYRSKEDMNPILLKLAKLDFNMVQATHQEDQTSVKLVFNLPDSKGKWWRSIGLGEKSSFVRNRLTENFFWNVGCTFHPQFGYSRRISTKANLIITVMDDVYDVYGTLDELDLFTNAVESWNINAMDGLPDYMKMCFLALQNLVNEMAFDTLKEQGFHIIQSFKKSWANIC
ncbi:hypothetical protein ACJW31_12G098900 [Castanea mollissima]